MSRHQLLAWLATIGLGTLLFLVWDLTRRAYDRVVHREREQLRKVLKRAGK